MSRIGFLCPPAIGHLKPMCVLGNELQHRGHVVTLFGIPDVREKILKSGLNFYEIGANDYPRGSLEFLYTNIGQLSGIKGINLAIKNSYKATRMMFRDAPDVIIKAGIDLLIVDQVIAAGGTVADYLNIPFVTICNALPMNQEPGVPPSFVCWGYSPKSWAKIRNQLAYRFINYLTLPVWKLVNLQRHQWQLP